MSTVTGPPPPPAPRSRRFRIAKGTTVHVLSGPFEGKVGVVQEVDGKGSARVVLGTMSSWVSLGDLRNEAPTERPPFRSSHRKPGR